MSRNKDIKTLHSITGLNYSYLRKILKKNHWEFWDAYFEVQNELIYNASKLVKEFNKGLKEVLENVAKEIMPAVKAFEEFRETIMRI